MIGRVHQMVVKEFLQTFRDPHTRFILFVPPLVQMLVFGYAATLEVQHVRTAVLDLDNSQESRELVSRFAGSRYFDVRSSVDDRRQMHEAIVRGRVSIGIEIDSGFARELRKGSTATVQVIVDAAISNTTLIALGYTNQVTAKFAAEQQRAALARRQPQLVSQLASIELEARPWYNSDRSSRWFFVPGVIGNLIQVMVVMLTAFAVVREREIGTLEQIMVTPIRRSEFILGKTIPFVLVGIVDAALISLVGALWFGVPFRGSLTVFVLGTVGFLVCALATGLLISTISATQQQAMVSAFFVLMPAVIFSGFATPVSSMPPWLRWVSYADPLRYYLIILRGVYLKGLGMDVSWRNVAILFAAGLGLLALSMARFRKSLD